MTDINNLRRLALDGDLFAILETLNRLEASEKDYSVLKNHCTALEEELAFTKKRLRDKMEMIERELRAKLAQLHKEADKFDDGIDWIQRALQAETKIAEMKEQQEPAAWMDKNGTLYNTVSHVRASDRPLYFTSSISEGWLRAIDEALVVAHIGVANESDTYEQAKAKLDSLICEYVDIATDPAVNGGYKLVSVRLRPKTKGAME